MRFFYLLLLCTPAFIFSQTDGLVAYYAFNGSAIDSSTFEHHGAAVNAELGEDLLGMTGNAYVFNGSDSYITAGTAETLEIDTALTISVWFKATGSGSPNAGGILVNKEGEYSFARFADGSIRYALAFNGVWDNHINTGITVPLNENTHAVLSYSRSSGEVKVYVNCELLYTKNENAVIGDFTPDMNEMRIGGRMFLNQFFDGTIDEVKIFNRALTIAEIENNCILSNTEELTIEKIDLQIYPNPTSGDFKIKGDISKIEKIRVFNANGRLIKEINADFENVSIAGYPSGIYILAFYGKNNQMIFSSKRIIRTMNRV